jgi:hypothetical protein
MKHVVYFGVLALIAAGVAVVGARLLEHGQFSPAVAWGTAGVFAANLFAAVWFVHRTGSAEVGDVYRPRPRPFPVKVTEQRSGKIVELVELPL